MQRALSRMLTELTFQDEVSGVILFGSVQTGRIGPGSDIDLLIVTDGHEYWREGKMVLGIPFDLFFNPVSKLLERFHDEDAVMLQAAATGDVLYDRHQTMEHIVQAARRLWSKGPSRLSQWNEILLRYRIGSLAQDLKDAPERDPQTLMLSMFVVQSSLEGYLTLHQHWPVPVKHLLERIDKLDPALGQDARRFFSAMPDKELALYIADKVIEPFGGRVTHYSIPKERMTERGQEGP